MHENVLYGTRPVSAITIPDCRYDRSDLHEIRPRPYNTYDLHVSALGFQKLSIANRSPPRATN
jgi:hypothetical protein